MVALALGALWAWGMIFPVAAAELPLGRSTQDAMQAMQDMDPSGLTEQLSKRQSTNTSPCKAYGIDFQDGGSYFIDQRSTQPFQAVTKFEGCQKSDADVLLVNRETSQQYNCGRIPTTPDDKPRMATCSIREADMKSGNWSLLILGDNGLKGTPYAYERDFTLSVAPQKTLTVSKTCIFTYTEKPTSTVTSIYTVATTNVVPNSLTITKPAATNIITLTPKPSTVSATKTTTRTFTTWTRTEDRSTAVVTPQCVDPPKPMLPDPQCKIVPTIKPVPQGLNIAANHAAASKPVADRAADVQQIRKRFENLAAAEARIAAEDTAASSAPAPAPAAQTGGNQPTLTITARNPINSTTTTTLPAKTVQAISTRTATVYTTAAPSTVYLGTAMQTVYAPASTETVWQRGWTRVYDVQTMSVQWTWTSTKSVGPEASGRCRAMGGRVV